MKELVESIKRHEGFRGEVYKDTLGFDTIGYGTKLPLSKEESQMLLESRLKKFIKEMETKEPFINKLPIDKQMILVEMVYQMGVNGVLNFRNMWKALKVEDYETASKEMLNSRWAIQAPNRAKKLAEMMRG